MKENHSMVTAQPPLTTLTTSQCSSASPFNEAITFGQITPPVFTTTSVSTNSTTLNNLSTLLIDQLAGNRLLSLPDKAPSFLPHIDDRKSPSTNNAIHIDGVPESSEMPISLLSSNRIFDNALQQLSKASDENLVGKRNLDLGLKLKLRNPTARKSNGHGHDSGSASKSANESSMSKIASKVSNIINGSTSGIGNSVHDDRDEEKKTRKRPREKKEREKGEKEPRGKAGPAALQNGGTPVAEPTRKKTKLDNGVRQTWDQSSCTASMATFTEPDLIGPLEPGTPVTLEGIVWHESVTKGFVVVNVTWRGKTYMGTLMDYAQIEWAPPRHCDSPPSDLDCNRSPVKDKNSKRGRNGAMGVAEGGDYTPICGPLRGGRNRRGANFSTPASPARSDISATGKRKGRVPNSLKILRSSESKDNNLMDLASPSDENQVKKGKRVGSGTSTPSAENAGQLPSSPALLECPEPNCSKKYKHPNGLRYHQQHQHDEEKNMEFQCEFQEDTSSNGDMSRVNCDNDASLTNSVSGRTADGETTESSLGASTKIDEGPFELALPKEYIQKDQPATTGSDRASSSNVPTASTSAQLLPLQNQSAVPSTSLVKTEPETVAALSAAPPLIFALKSALESPSIFNYPSIQPPAASILSVDGMQRFTTAIDVGPGAEAEEDVRSQKQRSKQRRKQSHPISSNQKKSTSSAAEEEIVSPAERKENLTNIPETEAESIPDTDPSNRINTGTLAAPPLAKLDLERSKSKTVQLTASPLAHPSRPPPLDPTLARLPVVPGSRSKQNSKSGKEKLSVVAESAKLRPSQTSLEAVMGSISPAAPLDLKISPPIHQTVMKSPSAPDNRTMSEQPKSPAYSDISDDNEDGRSEIDMELPSMPTSVSTSGPVDRSPFPFPYFPETPFLLTGTPELDAKRASPSDPQKKLLMGQFPPFIYGPVAGPRQDPSNPPDGPFPSPCVKPPVDTNSQSQDIKLKPATGRSPPLRPNSATKSRSLESKLSKEPAENIRGEKPDAKCKSPSVKEASRSRGYPETKPELGKSKEDSRGPMEDHGAMQHKVLSAPQQHMFHPQYMNQMFRPGMQQPGFSPAAHPMFMNRSMYGPQDQLQMLNIAAMYGFANPVNGRPGPMPPGLPPLSGQDPSALEMLQQRLGPSGQPSHKIHELTGFSKHSSSSTSTSASLENQNPSSSPGGKKSTDASPKNNIGGGDERSNKNKPDRSSASPLLRDQRNSLHPLRPAISAPYLNSPQMSHHMDPYQMLPGQRPPPLHLPSRNHN